MKRRICANCQHWGPHGLCQKQSGRRGDPRPRHGFHITITTEHDETCGDFSVAGRVAQPNYDALGIDDPEGRN